MHRSVTGTPPDGGSTAAHRYGGDGRHHYRTASGAAGGTGGRQQDSAVAPPKLTPPKPVVAVSVPSTSSSAATASTLNSSATRHGWGVGSTPGAAGAGALRNESGMASGGEAHKASSVVTSSLAVSLQRRSSPAKDEPAKFLSEPTGGKDNGDMEHESLQLCEEVDSAAQPFPSLHAVCVHEERTQERRKERQRQLRLEQIQKAQELQKRKDVMAPTDEESVNRSASPSREASGTPHLTATDPNTSVANRATSLSAALLGRLPSGPTVTMRSAKDDSLAMAPRVSVNPWSTTSSVSRGAEERDPGRANGSHSTHCYEVGFSSTIVEQNLSSSVTSSAFPQLDEAVSLKEDVKAPKWSRSKEGKKKGTVSGTKSTRLYPNVLDAPFDHSALPQPVRRSKQDVGSRNVASALSRHGGTPDPHPVSSSCSVSNDNSGSSTPSLGLLSQFVSFRPQEYGALQPLPPPVRPASVVLSESNRTPPSTKDTASDSPYRGSSHGLRKPGLGTRHGGPTDTRSSVTGRPGHEMAQPHPSAVVSPPSVCHKSSHNGISWTRGKHDTPKDALASSPHNKTICDRQNAGSDKSRSRLDAHHARCRDETAMQGDALAQRPRERLESLSPSNSGVLSRHVGGAEGGVHDRGGAEANGRRELPQSSKSTLMRKPGTTALRQKLQERLQEEQQRVIDQATASRRKLEELDARVAEEKKRERERHKDSDVVTISDEEPPQPPVRASRSSQRLPPREFHDSRSEEWTPAVHETYSNEDQRIEPASANAAKPQYRNDYKNVDGRRPFQPPYTANDGTLAGGPEIMPGAARARHASSSLEIYELKGRKYKTTEAVASARASGHDEPLLQWRDTASSSHREVPQMSEGDWRTAAKHRCASGIWSQQQLQREESPCRTTRREYPQPYSEAGLADYHHRRGAPSQDVALGPTCAETTQNQDKLTRLTADSAKVAQPTSATTSQIPHSCAAQQHRYMPVTTGVESSVNHCCCCGCPRHRAGGPKHDVTSGHRVKLAAPSQDPNAAVEKDVWASSCNDGGPCHHGMTFPLQDDYCAQEKLSGLPERSDHTWSDPYAQERSIRGHQDAAFSRDTCSFKGETSESVARARAQPVADGAPHGSSFTASAFPSCPDNRTNGYSGTEAQWWSFNDAQLHQRRGPVRCESHFWEQSSRFSHGNGPAPALAGSQGSFGVLPSPRAVAGGTSVSCSARPPAFRGEEQQLRDGSLIVQTPVRRISASAPLLASGPSTAHHESLYPNVAPTYTPLLLSRPGTCGAPEGSLGSSNGPQRIHVTSDIAEIWLRHAKDSLDTPSTPSQVQPVANNDGRPTLSAEDMPAAAWGHVCPSAVNSAPCYFSNSDSGNIVMHHRPPASQVRPPFHPFQQCHGPATRFYGGGGIQQTSNPVLRSQPLPTSSYVGGYDVQSYGGAAPSPCGHPPSPFVVVDSRERGPSATSGGPHRVDDNNNNNNTNNNNCHPVVSTSMPYEAQRTAACSSTSRNSPPSGAGGNTGCPNAPSCSRGCDQVPHPDCRSGAAPCYVRSDSAFGQAETVSAKLSSCSASTATNCYSSFPGDTYRNCRAATKDQSSYHGRDDGHNAGSQTQGYRLPSSSLSARLDADTSAAAICNDIETHCPKTSSQHCTGVRHSFFSPSAAIPTTTEAPSFPSTRSSYCSMGQSCEPGCVSTQTQSSQDPSSQLQHNAAGHPVAGGQLVWMVPGAGGSSPCTREKDTSGSADPASAEPPSSSSASASGNNSSAGTTSVVFMGASTPSACYYASTTQKHSTASAYSYPEGASVDVPPSAEPPSSYRSSTTVCATGTDYLSAGIASSRCSDNAIPQGAQNAYKSSLQPSASEKVYPSRLGSQQQQRAVSSEQHFCGGCAHDRRSPASYSSSRQNAGANPVASREAGQLNRHPGAAKPSTGDPSFRGALPRSFSRVPPLDAEAPAAKGPSSHGHTTFVGRESNGFTGRRAPARPDTASGTNESRGGGQTNCKPSPQQPCYFEGAAPQEQCGKPGDPSGTPHPITQRRRNWQSSSDHLPYSGSKAASVAEDAARPTIATGKNNQQSASVGSTSATLRHRPYRRRSPPSKCSGHAASDAPPAPSTAANSNAARGPYEPPVRQRNGECTRGQHRRTPSYGEAF